MKTLRHLIAEKTATAEAFIGMIQAGRFQRNSELFDFMRKLENDKIVKNAGEGAFAMVFAGRGKNPELAFKIIEAPDAAYGKFVSVAKENAGRNPLFPRIMFYGPATAEGIMCAFVEHVEVDARELDERVEKILARLNGETYKPGLGLGQAGELFKFEYPIWAEGRNPYKLDRIFAEVAKEFHTTTEYLKDFYDRVSPAGKWDLHAGNIGLRRNGELVFFDPVSSRGR